MTLKVLSWSVAGFVRGFNRHFSVANFEAHNVGYFVAAGMVDKLDGVSVGAHNQFTPSGRVGDCDAQHSSYISVSAHLTHKDRKVGRNRDSFGGKPGFHAREIGTTLDLVW